MLDVRSAGYRASNSSCYILLPLDFAIRLFWWCASPALHGMPHPHRVAPLSRDRALEEISRFWQRSIFNLRKARRPSSAAGVHWQRSLAFVHLHSFASIRLRSLAIRRRRIVAENCGEFGAT